MSNRKLMEDESLELLIDYLSKKSADRVSIRRNGATAGFALCFNGH